MPGDDPPPRQGRGAQLVKAISGIASLLALFSALLYYFGWVRSEYQARAFGADASVFSMSSQELVIRSADVLFPPLLLVLLASVLAVWIHTRLLSAGGDTTRRRRVVRVARVLSFAWMVALVGAAALLAVAPTTGRFALPFLFAIGVGGSWYAHTLRSRLSSAVRAVPTPLFFALAALMAVSAFWMTERIARLGAEARVEAIKGDVGGMLEAVTIYSAGGLHLAGGTLTESKLGDPKAMYQYRYDGLFLLQKSGGSYFLITDGWNERGGRLIVLPEDKAMRIEFGPGR